MEQKKIVKLFLKNGFYYQGRYITQDDKFLHFIDRKTGKLRILNLDEVREMEFEGGLE